MKKREDECREALVGCIDCKDELAERIAEDLQGFRERRNALQKTPGVVDDILKEGASKVNPIASKCLERVRLAMNMGII